MLISWEVGNVSVSLEYIPGCVTPCTRSNFWVWMPQACKGFTCNGWWSSVLASVHCSTGEHMPSPDTEQLTKRASMWYCMPRESATCLWTGWCVFLRPTPVHTSKFLLISEFFLHCTVEKAIVLVSCCCVFRNVHRLIHSVKVTVKAAPLRLRPGWL